MSNGSLRERLGAWAAVRVGAGSREEVHVGWVTGWDWRGPGTVPARHITHMI